MKCIGLLCTLFVLFSNLVLAQVETVYFNADWKKTSKDSAIYFGYRNKKLPNGMYEICDYYISNGKPQMIACSKDKDGKILEGKCLRYYEDGSVEHEMVYSNNEVVGISKEYWKGTDKLSWVKNWRHGQFHGDVIAYYKNGAVKRKEYWKHGKMKHGKCYTAAGNDTAYFYPKCCPIFPGGWKKYQAFIRQNLKYPQSCKKDHIAGMVLADVTFDTTGKVRTVVIAESVHPLLDAEAKRLMLAMPKWDPALDDEEKPVEFYRNLGVIFDDVSGGAFFISPVGYLIHHML